MYRISTNLTNDGMQFHLRRREFNLNQTHNRIAGQERILNLRDAPIDASHAVRFESFLERLERFSTNMEFAQSTYRQTEGIISETVDILHRIREIGVQGANGIYAEEDRRYMALEMEQLLRELVSITNKKDPSGNPYFSGGRINVNPFRAFYGTVLDGTETVITDVEYLGNIESRSAEISDGSYIDLDFAGNRTFWAEQQQIISSTAATNYQVSADTNIYIDGVEINLTAGDTISAIVSKINSAAAAVEARLDPVQNSLILQTTSAHQMWLSEDGTVLQDLGILSPLTANTGGGAGSTATLANDADVFGGSMFDVVIRMRDALFQNDGETIGGSALQGIDSALDNVLTNLSELGARDERVQVAYARNERDIPEITEHYSNLTDPDLTEEITNLRILEQTHQAALAVTSRITSQTLLDFLR